MAVAHDTKNIPLTSGEIAELFNTCINNSASLCVLSYFSENTQDPDIAAVVKQSLELSKKAVQGASDILRSVNHPTPHGFTMEDVDLTSEKLYSDTYMLTYVRYMARFGLTNYGEARASAIRSDVRDFFNRVIQLTMELFNHADDVLLAKGLLIKPPTIPIPRMIDYVSEKAYLGGFFGEKRPLNASEMNRIFLNFQRNSLGKALITGFCQTAKNKDIQKFFLRGRELSDRHIEVMGTLLKKDGLAVPPTMDDEVLDSTDPVFSDRLMMFHLVALDALGLATNGITLSRVMRRDLALNITRLMSEIALYAEDGFRLMIENGWFERIPENADREELIKG